MSLNIMEFENKEYKDILYCTTIVSINFWQRVMNLFCPKISFEVKVYCEEIMPKHKAVSTVNGISYWNMFKSHIYKKRGYTEIVKADCEHDYEEKEANYGQIFLVCKKCGKEN